MFSSDKSRSMNDTMRSVGIGFGAANLRGATGGGWALSFSSKSKSMRDERAGFPFVCSALRYTTFPFDMDDPSSDAPRFIDARWWFVLRSMPWKLNGGASVSCG